ncbi:MAG TPA: DUF2254 domain-containing protein [Bacteriovoracaceae bacterium]|nr:DUF2254 domain-containing protein [Bacteriovoracaceae bacterium]
MAKKWLFTLIAFSKRLSARAAFFALLGVVASLVSVLLDDFVPDKFADLAGGRAVDGILSIMASSMLIVVTFSLSNVISAYSSATQQATPRATVLIRDDPDTQSAISIFLGAFIYSIVSVIALSTGYYGEKGRVILLIITVLVLMTVVWVIIRWVDKLKNMGSVSKTIQSVEYVTRKALEKRAQMPTFGCNLRVEVPVTTTALMSPTVGFIQNIDISYLEKLAEKEKLDLYFLHDIGAFVSSTASLVLVRRESISKKVERKILKAFAIGNLRTFDNDPIYGVSTLSGIAIKALSPAVNDPGTAIDVAYSLLRVFISFEAVNHERSDEGIIHKHLYFPELDINELFHQAFYYLIIESVSNLQVTKTMNDILVNVKDLPNAAFLDNADKLLRVLASQAMDKRN